MEKEMVKVCAEGLSFFGRSNRLISHELKNILAIISETMGLLEELAELSETGTPLTPEKIHAMSASILEEVERANGVIRCMNRLGHSADRFAGEVDLGEMVSLGIELVQLNPAGKAVTIECLKDCSGKIDTSPFFLLQLLYRMFYFALSAAASQRGLQVSIQAGGGRGGKVNILGVAPEKIKYFPTQEDRMLMKILDAEILSDPASGRLQAVFPPKLEQGSAAALSAGWPR